MLDHLLPLLAIGAPSAGQLPAAGALALGRRLRGAGGRRGTGRRRCGWSPGRPPSANLEVKCFDLAANPYLVVGALIAAGLDGIDRELRLPAEVDGDPARLEPAEAAARGWRGCRRA